MSASSDPTAAKPTNKAGRPAAEPMERRGPAVCNFSGNQGGKDEMTKASNDLQDLRRRIYVKAKTELRLEAVE
jgi:hypothetical protein